MNITILRNAWQNQSSGFAENGRKMRVVKVCAKLALLLGEYFLLLVCRSNSKQIRHILHVFFLLLRNTGAVCSMIQR